MEPRALIVIFGSLALLVSIFVGGFWAPGIWKPIMIGVGGAGGIAWLGFALWLGNAMNSDV